MNNIVALIGFILVMIVCTFQLYYDELKKIVSERILKIIIIISFVAGVIILYAIGI